MTAFIRKNPFATTDLITAIDPKTEMIRLLSEHASSVGSPLSDSDRQLLASENPVVDGATESRLRALVSGVIANQKATGRDSDPKSFVSAVEWATDGEWPYVAALAEAEITGAQVVERFERRDFSAWWLLPGCLVIIVLIALIVLLARKLF